MKLSNSGWRRSKRVRDILIYNTASIYVGRLVDAILAEMARPEELPDEPLGFGQTDAIGIWHRMKDRLYPYDAIEDFPSGSQIFSSEPEVPAYEPCMQEFINEEAFADTDTQVSCVQVPAGPPLEKDNCTLGIDACVRSGCAPVADIFKGIPAYEDYTSELDCCAVQTFAPLRDQLSLSYHSAHSPSPPSPPVKKRGWECAFRSTDSDSAVDPSSVPSPSIADVELQRPFTFGSSSNVDLDFDFVLPLILEPFDKAHEETRSTNADETENAPRKRTKWKGNQTTLKKKRKGTQTTSKKRKVTLIAWDERMPAPIRLVIKDFADCPYPGCKLIFDCHDLDIPDVTAHLHEAHSLTTWKPDNNGKLTCAVVGCQEVFGRPKANEADRSKNIGRHFATGHMGFLKYICPSCGIKSFDRGDAAKRHIANTPSCQRLRQEEEDSEE